MMLAMVYIGRYAPSGVVVLSSLRKVELHIGIIAMF